MSNGIWKAGIAPRQIDSGVYRGSTLSLMPVINLDHAPTVSDRNFPLFTIARNGDEGAIHPHATGDMWYLSKFEGNVGDPNPDAIWIKISSGDVGPLVNIDVPEGTSPVFPDPNGTITYTSNAGTLDITGSLNTINFDLVGGGVAVDSFTVPLGTSPVVPDSNGNISITAGAGVSITGGTNTYEIALTGSGQAVDSFAVPHGTSPVVPDANGLITITEGTGVVVTGGLNTYSIALNGSAVGQTITGQSGGALSPVAGNWNIFGLGEMTTSGSGNTLSALQPRAAKFIVDPTQYYGTHQTITAALTAASAGDLILVRPATYTENPVFKAGVDICALGSGGVTPSVTINGKCTATFAGTCTITGIRLQTNSDFALEVSGSSATIVNLSDCYINAVNNTAISYTSSNASSEINIKKSQGNIGTTGITYFSKTSPGSLDVSFSQFPNTGATTTASTNSAGSCNFRFSAFLAPLSFSGTSASNFQNVVLDTINVNTASITLSDTASGSINSSRIASGTASCIVIGAGCFFSAASNRVNSTNTNVFTGAGEIDTGGNVCINSSGNDVAVINNLTVI